MFAGLNVNGILTVMYDGKTYTANTDHINYKGLKDAFIKRDGASFVSLCDIPTSVRVLSRGNIVVDSDRVLYKGVELHNTVVDRMLNLLRDGYDIQYLVNFLVKLLANPSKNSVDQLYLFLEKHFLPITEDGDFLAYKVVRSDFKDKYTGTFDNSIGQILKCERNQVCDNPDIACSYGFHAGSREYSGRNGTFYSPGDNIIVVKINPANVVSVPRDCNAGKIRTCEYEVISLLQDDLDKQVYKVVDNNYSPSYKFNDEYEANYESYDEDEDEEVIEYDEFDFDEDESYVFEYEGETRYVTVEVVEDNYITAKCIMGDKSSGFWRSFNYDKIVDLRLV